MKEQGRLILESNAMILKLIGDLWIKVGRDSSDCMDTTDKLMSIRMQINRALKENITTTEEKGE